MKTGFKAYAMYLFIKNIHFRNNDFNAMRFKDIPLEDKLINSWNKKRRKVDGKRFQAIENECNDIKSLAFLYSSYYIKNSDFYIQDIFEDDFETFKQNQSQVKHIEEQYLNDLNEILDHCSHNQIKPQDLFYAKTSIAKIFKLNLSINSLIILNDLFNIIELNKDVEINLLEVQKWETLKIILIKYKLIIQSALNKYNWKKITKKCLTDRK